MQLAGAPTALKGYDYRAANFCTVMGVQLISPCGQELAILMSCPCTYAALIHPQVMLLQLVCSLVNGLQERIHTDQPRFKHYSLRCDCAGPNNSVLLFCSIYAFRITSVCLTCGPFKSTAHQE